MKINTLLFIIFLAASPSSFAELDRSAIENYQPDATTLESVKNAYEKRATIADDNQAVKEMGLIINSREFQEHQATLRKEIASAMGVNDWMPADKDGETKKLPYSARPILFASSSVPLATLRNYIADLERVNGVMVFRGFIGGMNKVMPSLNYMDALIKKSVNCKKEPCERYQVPVLIDPILFREYAVKSVPAFAVHGLTNLSAYCNGTDGLNPSQYIVYGDSSVKYLSMKLYEKSGDELHKLISEAL